MNLRNYRMPPAVPSTMEDRTKALQAAKPLLSDKAFLTNGKADVEPLIRVAEYITTGHDYLDTHSDEDNGPNGILVIPDSMFSGDPEHPFKAPDDDDRPESEGTNAAE